MAVTTKRLKVRPSAGDGVSTPIPHSLSHFCTKLEAAQPTTLVETADRDRRLHPSRHNLRHRLPMIARRPAKDQGGRPPGHSRIPTEDLRQTRLARRRGPLRG